MINTPDQRIGKLNFDGAYTNEKGTSHIATEYKNGVETKFKMLPYLKYPLFFYKNGLVLMFEGDQAFNDSIINTKAQIDLYKKWSFCSWGSYEVINDTIKAIVYQEYFGKAFRRYQLRPTYFIGILKNKDSILQWHMIPPYPDIPVEIMTNKEVFDFLKTPKDLFFTSVPEMKFVDPDKAWINEYRDKQ